MTAIRNILVAPIILVVRVPVIFTLLVLIKIGEMAESVYDFANETLPAFKR